MHAVNTHEAKTKLSSLLAIVERQGEVVMICRDGHPVAELHAVETSQKRGLPPVDASLAPVLAYDPTEPATEDEWPGEMR